MVWDAAKEGATAAVVLDCARLVAQAKSASTMEWKVSVKVFIAPIFMAGGKE
jgi:hypothetical protein